MKNLKLIFVYIAAVLLTVACGGGGGGLVMPLSVTSSASNSILADIATSLSFALAVVAF